MTKDILATLTRLRLSPTQQAQLGLPPEPLQLRRSWPRSAGQLGLEYVAADGQVMPGQWFSDPDQLQRVAQATIRAGEAESVLMTTVDELPVLLQGRGADRRLPGLRPLLAQPGAKLLVHRPERRAVVRLEGPDGPRFAKVVRPEQTTDLVESCLAAQALAGDAFTTPALLEIDSKAGVVISSALPGTSLYELVGQPELVAAAQRAGAALRGLHATPPVTALGRHQAAAERGLLQRWFDRLEIYIPDWSDTLRGVAAPVLAGLAGGEGGALVPLHRDFYDKQIFVTAAGQVGLLDFDTLTSGEAALDLANALVHFELRALLGHCSTEQAAAAAQAMLSGYGPSPAVQARLPLYADATRLRLACVYAFRPYGLSLFFKLLDRVNQPDTTFSMTSHSQTVSL